MNTFFCWRKPEKCADLTAQGNLYTRERNSFIKLMSEKEIKMKNDEPNGYN